VSWVRKLLNLLIVLALVAAVGFALYAVGRVAVRKWGAILWWTYMAGAVLSLFFGVFFAARLGKAGDWDDRLFVMSGQIAVSQQSTFTRLRTRLSRVLRLACGAFTWPAMILISQWRAFRSKGTLNIRTVAILSQLSADDLTIAPGFVAGTLAVILGVLFLSRTSSPYALLFCICAAAYVSLFCVELTVSSLSLAQRLRRASGNPYRNAVILALITAFSLILAYAVLLAGGFPHLAHLDAAFRGLYSQLDSAQEVIRGHKVSGLALAQGVSGALFVSAVIGGILSLRDFKRTDDDLVALAQTKLMLGRSAEALNALRGVGNPSVASSSAEAIALIGVGQAERAIEVWPKHSKWASSSSFVGEEGRTRALLHAVMLHPLSPRSLLVLLKRWLQMNPAEKFVCAVLGQIGALQRATIPQLLATLAESGPPETYPVATAVMKLRNGDLAAALALTEAAPVTEDVVEYVRSSTLLLAKISGPTDRAADREIFETWCEQYLVHLTDICVQLADETDLGMAIGMASELEKMATVLDSAHLEGVRFLTSSLVIRLKSVAPDKDATQIVLQNLLPPAIAEPKL
jgi:hypothetical protein